MIVEQIVGQTGHTMKCRWCEKEIVIVVAGLCPNCECWTGITVQIMQGQGPRRIEIYHNPDNSLFFEFIASDEKTARYTLSPEILMRAGMLELSDTPLGGKRTKK